MSPALKNFVVDLLFFMPVMFFAVFIIKPILPWPDSEILKVGILCGVCGAAGSFVREKLIPRAKAK